MSWPINMKTKSSLNIEFNSSFISVKNPSSESVSNFKLIYNFGFFKGLFVITEEISSILILRCSKSYS